MSHATRDLANSNITSEQSYLLLKAEQVYKGCRLLFYCRNVNADITIICYLSKGDSNINYNGYIDKDGNKYLCRHLALTRLIGQLNIKAITSDRQTFEKNGVFNENQPMRPETNDNNIVTRYQELQSYRFNRFPLQQILTKITITDYKEIIQFLEIHDYKIEADKLKKLLIEIEIEIPKIKLESVRQNIIDSSDYLESRINCKLIISIDKFLEGDLSNDNNIALIIISFFTKKYPLQGYLLDTKTQGNCYSFSINSFPDLLFNLCEILLNDLDNEEYKFLFLSPKHAMNLFIKKKPEGCINIEFYDPNITAIAIKTTVLSIEEITSIDLCTCLLNKDDLQEITCDIPWFEEMDDLHLYELIHYDPEVHDIDLIRYDGSPLTIEIKEIIKQIRITKCGLLDIALKCKMLGYEKLGDSLLNIVEDEPSDSEDQQHFKYYFLEVVNKILKCIKISVNNNKDLSEDSDYTLIYNIFKNQYKKEFKLVSKGLRHW